MKSKRYQIFVSAMAVACLALAGGCAKKTADSGSGSAAGAGKAGAAKAGAAKAGAAADVAAAKKVFAGRCTACHGDKGLGDGPGAKALKPKPRAFSDVKWQSSVTDDQIKKTIISGGLAVGKSAIMPGNPDLKGKEAVLNGLVKLIRSFKK